MQSQPQSLQTNSGSSLDNDKVIQLLTSLTHGVQNQAKKVDELKKQMRQVVEFMGQFREQGKLPSSTIVNPKGKFESANAITLRSGKTVETSPKTYKSNQVEDEKLQQEEETLEKATARVQKTLPQPLKSPNSSNTGKMSSSSVNSNPVPPNVLFLCRFMQSKKEGSEKDILDTFRKVQVNISLLDAIK